MKKLLLAAFSFVHLGLLAQNYVDIFRVNLNSSPQNNFKNDTSTTRLNELLVDLNVPIKLSPNAAIITGLIYDGIQVKLFPNQGYTSLSGYTLKAGITGKLNEKWAGTWVLLPKVAANKFNAWNSDIFQMGSMAFLKYNKKDNFNYRMGVYANSDLFGTLLVPILGLYYLSPNQKFETTMMIPFSADVNYKLSSLFHVGVAFNAQIRTFFLAGVASENTDAYVTKSTNELFAYARFNCGKNFILQARIGESLGRHYRVFDSDDKVSLALPALYFGDKRKQLNSDFSNGLIFQFSILYRINLPR